MKILILGTNQYNRFNRGHELFKREIARQHDVKFWGPGYPLWGDDYAITDLEEIFHEIRWEPDIILTYMAKYAKWIRGAQALALPKVHIVIDYFPWCYSETDKFLDEVGPDLIFCGSRHIVDELGNTARWLPLSVDINEFVYNREGRDLDVTAFYSTVSWAYPTRKAIIETIKGGAERGWKVFAESSTPKNRIVGKDYIDLLCSSKIVVNGVDPFGSLNWKFFEPLACGTFLLTEESSDFGEAGFLNHEHCVIFDGMTDLVDKINYYLEHRIERRHIAEWGRDFVRKHHSCEARVKEMIEVIEREVLS